MINSFSDNKTSVITCSVYSQNNQKLCVSCVYIPPTYSLSGSPIISYLYDVIDSTFESQIICGDFNCPGVNWIANDGPTSSLPLLDWCMDNFFTQKVLKSTRPQSNSLLDLVFFSITTRVSDVSINECFGSSDHSIVSFSVAFSCNPRYRPTCGAYVFSKANWKLFQKCLIDSSWPSLLNDSENINDIWRQYMENILHAVRRAIPFRRKEIWKPHNSSRVRTALRYHRRFFRQYSDSPTVFNWLRMNHSCSLLTSATKKPIYNHERNICNQIVSFSNSKPFWSYTKSRLKMSSHFSTICDESGECFTDDKDIADCFNNFFASNFNPRTDFASFRSDSAGTNTLHCVSFTADETFKIIKNLPASQSTDGDGLCYLFIKRGGYFLASKLSAFFTFSLARCSIPNAWRKIIVTPVHKSGPKDKCSNFRPIAITSCVGRIMERIIFKAMIAFFTTYAPLHSSQHGFLPGYSVETAGVAFFDFLTRHVDNGKLVDAIFLDFAKAFDSVPHSLLLKKLHAHGISGPLFLWMTDYLSNRLQVVRINQVFSDPTEVLSGVFQGSVLGPLLFLVFIDDIDDLVKNSLIIKYADDIKLAVAFDKDPPSQQLTCDNMQKDLNDVSKWCRDCGLSLNADKCVTLHFGGQNLQNQYFLCDRPLKQDSLTKDLGILLSTSLSFKEHIVKVVSKANRLLGLLKKVFFSREPLFLLILYKAYVRSVLECCCILWSPYHQYLINCVEKVQKRFCRFFKSLDGFDYRSKLAKLNLLSLQARRLRYKLIFLFKLFHCQNNLRADDFFLPSLRTVSHFPHCKLLVPLSKRAFRSNFFTVDVVKHWNNLSSAERNVDNIPEFKMSISSYSKRCGIW